MTGDEDLKGFGNLGVFTKKPAAWPTG